MLEWVPSAGHHASYASVKRASRTRCAVRDACISTGRLVQVLCNDKAAMASGRELQWACLGISAVLFKLRQQAGKLQLQGVALAAHQSRWVGEQCCYHMAALVEAVASAAL